ncbi:DUF6199 family natural product biosynthesis protein [Mycolicibacterium peregrinum]|uniref:DUF6199 family natural product biosynthesis protein n=1 Tax=Mycolicibacterium peregrinum TaxID=43304 RepID=UPI003AB10649
MGVGIFLIVVGVLVGGVMAAAPRGIWWATQSWKFCHPEANEPSDTAYGMTRLGGVLLIVVALFLGGSIISDGMSKSAAGKRQQEAEAQRQAAEAAFVVPQPEKRGLLPVIGYFADPTPTGMRAYVYYLAPGEAVHQYIRTMSDRFSYPCYTWASVTKADGDRKAADPELYWAPEELGDMSKSDRCRPGAGLNVHAVTSYDVTANTTIVTDSVIADRNGAEIRPAAPGNVVPKLAKALRTDP